MTGPVRRTAPSSPRAAVNSGETAAAEAGRGAGGATTFKMNAAGRRRASVAAAAADLVGRGAVGRRQHGREVAEGEAAAAEFFQRCETGGRRRPSSPARVCRAPTRHSILSGKPARAQGSIGSAAAVLGYLRCRRQACPTAPQGHVEGERRDHRARRGDVEGESDPVRRCTAQARLEGGAPRRRCRRRRSPQPCRARR